MGISYNKEYVPKDRIISGKGPRDRQIQQSHKVSQNNTIDGALIESLNGQIKTLQEQLHSSKSVNGWTDDQVNEEISKALDSELKVVRAEYSKEISILKEKCKVLEETLKNFRESREKDSDIMNKLREENIILKSENASLKEKINSKDEIIQQLKDSQSKEVTISEDKIAAMITEATKNLTLQSSDGVAQIVDKNRPQLETIFVDPSESQTNVETFIKVEDISIDQKEDLRDKVGKLKGLMGKFPVKRG